MVGPVTIPKVGISWHDMYESSDYMIALSLPKCEEEKQVHLHACTSSCLHDMVAERRL